jgi:hypothetical protein
MLRIGSPQDRRKPIAFRVVLLGALGEGMLPTEIGRKAFARWWEEYLTGLTKAELVDTYRLVYGGIERPDGTVEYPYGEDAVGYLVYLGNDRVSRHTTAADRPPFSDPDLLGGSPEGNDGAFRTSNGYFGKYSIQGNVVRYDIEVAPGAQYGGRDATGEQRRSEGC